MTSQIVYNNIYCGQMLWVRCSLYPYWPAIICPSDTGEITDTKYVHVSLCADNGRCWVKVENVFEFNGYVAFVKKMLSMKSQLSEDDFNVAFDTENNDAWRKAVIEGTFIFIKKLDKRLAYFDILKIQSLRENCKKPTSLTEMIFEHSSRSQLAFIEKIVGDNSNICEDIKQELNRISSIIDFDGTRTVAHQESVEDPDIVEQEGPVEQSDTFEHSDTAEHSNTAEHSDTFEHSDTTEHSDTFEHSDTTEHSDTLPEDFKKDLMKYIMKSYPKNILFRSIRLGNVCKICISLNGNNDDDLIKCSGACGDYVHRKCVNDLNASFVNLSLLTEPKSKPEQKRKSVIRIQVAAEIFCNECHHRSSSICYVCKEEATVELKQCNIKSCGRYYHTNCLDNWSQTKIINSKKVRCPLHVCHTCVAEDTEGIEDELSLSKSTRCIKCPTSYHIDSCCIPAGTIILTCNQHICIRHRSESRNHASLDWCFNCGEEGGVLLSCRSCPKTFHTSCLNSSNEPDPFLCHSCAIGKNPLYGDIVCAKFSDDPWWPAIIVPPFHIPEHMHDEPNNYNDEHDFCVQFFGTYEYGWMGRNSVYSYAKNYEKKLLIGEPKLQLAVTEAGKWIDELSELGNYNDVVKKKPPPYTKITTINPVAPAKIFKNTYLLPDPCSCTPMDDDPCGPSSSCKNRESYIECGSKDCPTGSNCRNQGITKKKFANVQVVFVGVKGFGLIASEFIPAGSLVCEYVGELVTKNELERRKSQKQSEHYYYMTYPQGLYIDAEFKGNDARFINHSCNPNCETQTWTVNGVDRIVFVALVDIEKGTEITTNYEFVLPQCYCGEENCIGSNNS